MIEIIPAILPKDFLEIQVKTAQIKNVSKLVQIDLCDGVYVATQTWPFNGTNPQELYAIQNQDDGLPFWQDVSFELDMMVNNAHKKFDQWLALGPSRIVFHLEAEDEGFLSWLEHLDIFYKEQIEIGIAINTKTSIEKVFPFIEHINFIQCMGVEHIGQQGQPFDKKVLANLTELRQRYPKLQLSVDGAVDFDSIEDLIHAGASRLVVGSAIFKSGNPAQTVKELHQFVQDIV